MSGGPYLCYRQLAATTGILFARFFSCEKEEYLITGSVNTLNVYLLDQPSGSERGDAAIVLVQTYPLFGRIGGIECLTIDTPSGSSEHILVSLDDGKYVVLQYSPVSNELKIRYMYNVEEGAVGEAADLHAESKGKRRLPGLYGSCPLTLVDKENALACSMLYGDQFFFVSIRSPLMASLGKAPESKFILDLSTYFPFPQVYDACFVAGFGRPTLAVLLSSDPVPIAHAKHRSHLAVVVYFTVDVASESVSLLWKQESLPNDCHQLIPVKNSRLTGSLLVVGINSCIMISPKGACGWASNGLASITVSPSIPLLPFTTAGCPHGVELDCSKWMAADEDTFICSLKDGRLMSVSLANFDENCATMASQFVVTLLAQSVVASCIVCSASGDAWFLASANGDSVLLSVAISKDARLIDQPHLAGGQKGMNTPSLKRRRVSKGATPAKTPSKTAASSVSMSAEEVALLVAAEENLFYGMSLKDINFIEKLAFHSTFILRVTAVLVGLGPLLSGLCGNNDEGMLSSPKLHWGESRLHNKGETGVKPHSAAAYIAERESRDGLQLSSGTGSDGYISRLYSGYRLNKVAARDYGDSICVNSIIVDNGYYTHYLTDKKNGVETRYEPRRHHTEHLCTLFFLTCKSGSTKMLISSGNRSETHKGATKTKHADPLMADFTEVSPLDFGFVADHMTIRTGQLCGGEIGIQITNIGVRVVDFSSNSLPTPLQDVLIEESIDIGGLGGQPNEKIVQGDISELRPHKDHENTKGAIGDHVVLLTSFGNVYVLVFDQDDRTLVLLKSTTFQNEKSNDDSDFVFAPAGSYSCVSLFHGIFPSPTVDSCNVEQRSGGGSSVEATPGLHINVTDSTSENSTTVAAMLAAEEAFMYGSALCSANSAEAMEIESEAIPCPVEEESYIILCDQGGRLHCANLSTMKYHCCTDNIGTGGGVIKLYNRPLPPSLSSVNDRSSKVVDALVSYVGRRGGGAQQDRLTITVCLDSADVVVYTSNSHAKTTLDTFVKVTHTVVTRRAKRRMKLRRVFSSARVNSAGPAPPPVSPLDDPMAYSLRRFTSLDGRSGVFCTGHRPLVVINDTGLPSVLPISLPELSFSSNGYYSLAPAAYAGGAARGLCSLWVELKGRADGFSADGTLIPPPPPFARPPPAAPVRAGPGFIAPPLPPAPPPGRPPAETVIASVLGLYRDVLGLTVLPNSMVMLKKGLVGHTVHQVQEVLANTDDKVQQSLLKTKTFLLSVSHERESDFKDDVLTEKDAADHELHYHRYFPSLKSFGQKSDALGPPPSEKRDDHSILLVQNNSVVDEYKLLPYETVLGVDTLYFDVSSSKPGEPMVMGGGQKSKKVVFVAACTSIDDRHGPDSQAEGRLLFFAVDYALYEGKSGGGDTSAATTAEAKEAVTGSSSNANTNAEATMAVVSGESVATDASTVVQSVQQSNFLDSISPKLKLRWTGPGPSTVIKQLGKRYAIATIGAVIYVYNYNPETIELDQLSFYMAPFYITSVNVLKNYIIIGDSVQGIQFLQWSEENAELTLLAKDYESVLSLNASFVADGNKLGMVTSDFEGNIQVLQYNPKVIESRGGVKLMPTGDFHLGSTVTMFLPHRLLSRGLPSKATAPTIRRFGPRANAIESSSGLRFEKNTCPKTCVLVGTVYGEFGCVAPVEERMHRRLMLLQQIMASVMETCCALNPREYRFIKTSEIKLERKRGVIDGTLLWNFMNLDIKTQDELCAAMGTTADAICENLLELELSWAFF